MPSPPPPPEPGPTEPRGPTELARRAARGDAAAFEQLVVETSPAVYALALRLVGNEHDAADVLQETYLRAFRAVGGFRGDAAVSTWLYRIAANCASTHLTRRSRARHAPIDEGLTVVETRPERDPEAVVSATSDRESVAAALAQLPASLRVVVVLRDVYDLPHEAIAAELGISRAAARVRLHRGRRLLREILYPPTARHDPVLAGSPRSIGAAGTEGLLGRSGESRPPRQGHAHAV